MCAPCEVQLIIPGLDRRPAHLSHLLSRLHDRQRLRDPRVIWVSSPRPRHGSIDLSAYPRVGRTAAPAPPDIGVDRAIVQLAIITTSHRAITAAFATPSCGRERRRQEETAPAFFFFLRIRPFSPLSSLFSLAPSDDSLNGDADSSLI